MRRRRLRRRRGGSCGEGGSAVMLYDFEGGLSYAYEGALSFGLMIPCFVQAILNTFLGIRRRSSRSHLTFRQIHTTEYT